MQRGTQSVGKFRAFFPLPPRGLFNPTPARILAATNARRLFVHLPTVVYRQVAYRVNCLQAGSIQGELSTGR